MELRKMARSLGNLEQAVSAVHVAASHLTNTIIPLLSESRQLPTQRVCLEIMQSLLTIERSVSSVRSVVQWLADLTGDES